MTGASAEAGAVRRSRREASVQSDDGAAARRARKEAKAAGTAPGQATGRRGGRFARRAGNYGRTILWTVRDTFGSGRGKLALALLLGGMSLAAQALAVLVVFGYGQAIQQDGSLTIPLLGIEWAARTETAFLLAVVGAFAASLSAAAVLNFASKGILLAILRRSLARALERLARAALRLPDPRTPRGSRLLAVLGFSALSTGATAATRSAFLVVQTIPALLGALLAAGVLFWLDPVLTAVLIVVTAAWSALLYPVSLRVVAFGRQMRRANDAIRREHGQVQASSGWAPASELARAYTGRLKTRAETLLVVGVGIAVVVAIAISVIGAEMMSGAQDWPVLIAYVGALQVALNGVFRTIRSVAIVSRNYPQMVRNRHFVLDLAGLGRPTASPRRGEAITLGVTAQGVPVVATPGQRLAVVADEPIERVQLIAIAARDTDDLPVRSARSSRRAQAPVDEAAPIHFVDARLLSGQGAAAELPGHTLTDRLVVVVHPTPATVGRFGEAGLIVMDGEKIGGYWPVGSQEAERALARAARRAARGARRGSDVDLAEEEDL